MPHPLVYDPVEASRERWVQQGWGDTAAGMAAVVSVMRAEQIFLNRAATMTLAGRRGRSRPGPDRSSR